VKEIISIEESQSAVTEDVKKLEDTMANDESTGMPHNGIPKDEESLAQIVSRGMPHEEEAAPDAKDIEAGIIVDVEVEGVGTIKVPVDPVSSTPKVAVEVIKTRTRVFNSGLKVIKAHNEKIDISVPPVISVVCNSLQRKVGHNEFSIVCKGHWNDDGTYTVSEEYKVPKQKVDGAAVDYDLDHLEQLKLEGYNTVIHSHPFKSSNFSTSDDETINSHFECSVLYSMGEFTTATIAVIPIAGTKLIITGNPSIEGEDGVVPESESNNIEKKHNDYVYNGGCNNQYNGYYGQYYNYRKDYDDDYDYRNNKGKTKNSKLIGSYPEECEKEYDSHMTSREKEKAYFESRRTVETENFRYDVDSDNLSSKGGKPIHVQTTERIKRANSLGKGHIAKSGGCCSERTDRVFKTCDSAPAPAVMAHADQKPGVFRTTDNNHQNKKGKNKNRQ
jgi:hypothetical protein